MKVLILSILVVVASAQYYPGYYNYGYNTGYNYNSGFRSYNYNPYPYVPYSSSQYHSQDELGQASYGYAYPGQASTTTRDAFGNQIGSYAYINAEGKEVRVSYVADSNGFRVLSNDLPQAPVDNLVAPVFTGEAPAPVEDTPEVIAAKAVFFKAFGEAAAAAAAAAPETEVYADETVAVAAPVPAEYAPEVVAARAEFFKLYDEAAAAAAAAPEERKKRSLFAYSYPVLAKSTIKTAHFEKDEAAMTPAATTKIELKEQEHEIVTPVAYHAPVYSAYAPVVQAAAVPVVRTVPTVPFVHAVHPIPAYAKTTIKTAHFEKDEAAKTPADTTKIELKEQEHDVITPVAYHAPVYSAYAPVVQAAAVPVIRTVPAFPVVHAVHPVPTYAKTTIKTAHFEKDEAAKTPADTTKIELKEQEHDVITPLAYAAPHYGYQVVV